MKRWRWLGLLAGGTLFFFVLRASDLTAVWQQIRGLHWRFGTIFLFYIVIFGLDTLGWRCALGPGIKIRLDRLFRARLAGEAVNYVTPTAWIGGEPVKAYLLSKRYAVPISDGMTSVVIAKTTFSISMLFFILAGIGVAFVTQPIPSALMRWVWVTLSVLSSLLGLFVIVQFCGPFRRLAAFFSAEGGSRQRSLAGENVPRWLEKIKSKISVWDESLTGFYRQNPKAVFWSLGFHFLGWMAGVVEVFLILRFLGIPVTVPTAWSIEALWVLLKSGAFLIPASLGASEGISLFVCVALGLSAVSGLALALVRRARELLWVGLGLAEFSRG